MSVFRLRGRQALSWMEKNGKIFENPSRTPASHISLPFYPTKKAERKHNAFSPLIHAGPRRGRPMCLPFIFRGRAGQTRRSCPYMPASKKRILFLGDSLSTSDPHKPTSHQQPPAPYQRDSWKSCTPPSPPDRSLQLWYLFPAQCRF